MRPARVIGARLGVDCPRIGRAKRGLVVKGAVPQNRGAVVQIKVKMTGSIKVAEAEATVVALAAARSEARRISRVRGIFFSDYNGQFYA